MNVLILAGGRGKRFNALTKKVPKHFLKVLNKPLIFYILDDILRQGFNKIELSLNYKRRFFIKQLKSVYGKKSKKFSFSHDKKMLGPWLPIIEKLKKEKGGEILACTGDIFAKINYKKLIKFHKKQKKVVTLVVAKTYPTPKAMTFKIKNNLIESCKRVTVSKKNDYINIGIYIVNYELLKFIPKKLNSFYEDNLFKIFVKNKLATAYIISEKGFNINTPYNLFCANLYQLKKNKNELIKPIGVKFYPPTFIGKKVKINKGSIIGPNVVIEDNVKIGENSRIKNSLIITGSKIKKNSRVNNTLIKQNLNNSIKINIGEKIRI